MNFCNVAAWYFKIKNLISFYRGDRMIEVNNQFKTDNQKELKSSVNDALLQIILRNIKH